MNEVHCETLEAGITNAAKCAVRGEGSKPIYNILIVKHNCFSLWYFPTFDWADQTINMTYCFIDKAGRHTEPDNKS